MELTGVFVIDDDSFWSEVRRDSSGLRVSTSIDFPFVFRYEREDVVWYSDKRRVLCIDQNGVKSRQESITRFMDEHYPIKLPYFPKKDSIICEIISKPDEGIMLKKIKKI